jgi:hypothetical protein
MAKATKRPDPRQMAVDAVQEWHDAIIQSTEAHNPESIYNVSLDQAFSEVTDALIAEERAEDREEEDAELREIRQQSCARTAGYLIGVQVGLRLRGGR